ncbi:YdcH family protein [Brevundimonas sp. TWP1-2-1b1]|uniref:YdcH family protein n=1 Tax=unclassified Brevundimonas TaxID=2622653 RepID=UPI003CF5CACB
MNGHFLQRLRRCHALLEAALEQEQRRPVPDAVTLARIKKRKLELQDRVRAMELKAASEGLHA